MKHILQSIHFCCEVGSLICNVSLPMAIASVVGLRDFKAVSGVGIPGSFLKSLRRVCADIDDAKSLRSLAKYQQMVEQTQYLPGDQDTYTLREARGQFSIWKQAASRPLISLPGQSSSNRFVRLAEHLTSCLASQVLGAV